MITRAHITRRAARDDVPARTVERDYVLAHIVAGFASLERSTGLVFKGGTALRLCHFNDYRYSADLDFSIVAGTVEELRCVLQRLQCRDLFDLSALLTEGGVDIIDAAAIFRSKAEHRSIDPKVFAARYAERLDQYRHRWEGELGEHVPGEIPHFEDLARRVSQQLRKAGLL